MWIILSDIDIQATPTVLRLRIIRILRFCTVSWNHLGEVTKEMRFLIFLLIIFVCDAVEDKITDEDQAKEWLVQYNVMAEQSAYSYVLARWNYYTNISDETQAESVKASIRDAQFSSEAALNASQFNWQSFSDEALVREFKRITDIHTAALPEDELTRVEKVGADMSAIYSTAKVCNKPGVVAPCLPLDPDLTELMAKSRDWDELEWAWKGWRDESGKKMRDLYEDYVALNNKAAKINGYKDTGDYWRSWYEQDNFEEDVARLFETVKPLYEQLHAYVRRKLVEMYPSKADEFPATGHIPAHILGNMWGQKWNSIEDDLRPFKNKQAVDVTDAMIAQGYNTTHMFRVAEDFFISLGLEPMVDSFWIDSMLEKPDDREVVCHAWAFDFYNRKDFRIKQCTETNMEWFLTTHHEMGHVEYFQLYKDLPVNFRDGANPGFHEAVGDVISLSVVTPEHLHSIGLLDEVEEDLEADLNYLMSQALKKVAFLPFGYLIDQWRWGVFREDTTPDNYNADWWNLRCNLQGLSPPVTRSEDDFDPGAKFHIPGSTPYIRYFVSFVLQFQLHEALCDAAGNDRPLHRCDIYNSKEAGARLRQMLQYGSSVRWPDALEPLTGGRTIEATSLLKYFKPLHDWLIKENEGYPVGWDKGCPEGLIVKHSNGASTPASSSFVALLTAFIYVMTFF